VGDDVKLKALGAAAGGGFPQWNCNASLSQAVREGRPGFRARTQSSLAASADGRQWVVFNASPDLRQQIAATPELHPRADGPLRNSPIEAVVLTNADVDHIAGLITLRESEPFHLYAHERVLGVLAANSVFNVLNPQFVTRRALPMSQEIALEGPEGPLGLTLEAFPVPGKIALFLEDDQRSNFGSEAGDTIGVRIARAGGGQDRACYYIPGCARIDGALLDRVEGAGCLFFDGTVFTDTEMADAGVGTKTGRRMGHIPISDTEGPLEAFRGSHIGRKVFIHINTTNPILEEGSQAERRVREAGWDIAYDGMEVVL
jgi:pyrroloquinoline quinone biosynthesis protein B